MHNFALTIYQIYIKNRTQRVGKTTDAIFRQAEGLGLPKVGPFHAWIDGDMIAKLLVDPGDLVVVEDPTYVGALQAFRPYQPTFATLPILLLWIFLGWLIVLCGALVAAHAALRLPAGADVDHGHHA